MNDVPAPVATRARTPKLGAPLAVFIHPFLGLCAAALLGYTLQLDDFVERLIYYCAAGIVLLVDLLMLVVEADRIAGYCKAHPLCRVLNALATLPVCIVLALFGNDELAAGFALLKGNWFTVLWSLKHFGTGLLLTLGGVGFGVYACELFANKTLIGSAHGKKP